MSGRPKSEEVGGGCWCAVRVAEDAGPEDHSRRRSHGSLTAALTATRVGASRTPLGCSGSWVFAGGGCSGQGALAGGAGAGPAVQQVLNGVEDLVEGESAVSAFGARRCSVRKAWAAVTRVTWWCQPVQERPSKWSRPRPCLSSR